MSTIHTLLSGINGYYFKQYEGLETEIRDVEYFSGHLKRSNDYSKTMFVCLTPERRSYINRKPVAWRDGNEQIAGKENEFGLIVTEKPIEDPQVTSPQFIVENSWEFLLKLSAKLRSRFTGPVIAITGSAGKTSTRMMISHLFQKEKVLENRGNHNVRFAIPLYMSKLVSCPDLLNLEVSVNALNSYDTGSMSHLIQPDIAIVTSIGEAHLSSLKDTKGVAVHKAKIFDGLKADGTAIINTDMGQEELDILLKAAKKKTATIFTYSLHDQTQDVYVKKKEQKRTYCEVTVSFFGEEVLLNLAVSSSGMISNALASLLTVWKLRGDLQPYLKAFETFKPLRKILDKTEYASEEGQQFTFIDDTHNASLPSMKNAIEYFNDVRPFYKGNSFLILGQIADLGEASVKVHEALKTEMKKTSADRVFGYGEQFKAVFEEVKEQEERFQWFSTLQELGEAINDHLNEDSLILAKGSVTGSDFQEIDKYIRQIAANHQLKSRS